MAARLRISARSKASEGRSWHSAARGRCGRPRKARALWRTTDTAVRARCGPRGLDALDLVVEGFERLGAGQAGAQVAGPCRPTISADRGAKQGAGMFSKARTCHRPAHVAHHVLRVDHVGRLHAFQRRGIQDVAGREAHASRDVGLYDELTADRFERRGDESQE